MEGNGNFKVFFKYVSLNILGMIGLSCYILADTFFVARGIGEDGLTALNLAIPIYSFIHGLGLMIGMGGATRYAIAKGMDDRKGADRIFTQAFQFTAVLALGLAVLGGLGADWLAALLGAGGDLHGMTAVYLRVILLFAPMFMTNNLMICFVRNDGSPQLSMLAMLIGSFSNIVLDYIFIFPFQMGMFGAVLATGIAPVISLMILSLHRLRKMNQFHLLKTGLGLDSVMRISSLGMSSLITEVSSGIVMIIFNGLILKLQGNTGVAAYGVIANLALVVVAVFTGIAQGIQPIISTDFGISDWHNCKKTFHYGVITAVGFALMIYLVSFVYSGPIVNAFNKDHNPLLADIAVNGMNLYFMAFVFTGVNIVTATFFSSVDKPKQAFAISFLRGFAVIIPMALLLADLFGMTGVWLALPVTETIVAVIGLFIYFGEKKGFGVLKE